MSGEEAGQTHGATRRAFIGAGAATAALAATGASPALARRKPKRYRETKRVDLHAHYIAPEYRAALTAAGITAIGGIPIPAWTPDAALKFMDGHGIAVQMLSVSDPGVDFLAPADAAKLATDCNDYLAQLVKDNPKRFGGFGVVSLQSPDAARAEAVRALDTLKLDGVGLLSSSKGRYLGDPAYDGLLGELNARKAWVFVHPTKIDGYTNAGDADYALPKYQIPAFVAEYPFDTTRTIISLIFNDVFERFPDIRWQFAHGGGTIPMLRFRLKVLAKAAPQFGALLGLPANAKNLSGKKALAALKGFHYDTALVGDKPSLRAVAGISKVANMHFGSDWPFASTIYTETGDPTPGLSDAFSNKQRRAIDRLNGRRQFTRLSFLPAK